MQEVKWRGREVTVRVLSNFPPKTEAISTIHIHQGSGYKNLIPNINKTMPRSNFLQLSLAFGLRIPQQYSELGVTAKRPNPSHLNDDEVTPGVPTLTVLIPSSYVVYMTACLLSSMTSPSSPLLHLPAPPLIYLSSISLSLLFSLSPTSFFYLSNICFLPLLSHLTSTSPYSFLPACLPPCPTTPISI